MVIALDPESTFEYVLRDDRKLPDEQQTVWLLRPMTAREYAEIENRSMRMDSKTNEAIFSSGTTTLSILKAGLAGVRNLVNDRGEPVPFATKVNGRNGNREEVRDEFLDKIHPRHLKELANAITERGQLTEEDREN